MEEKDKIRELLAARQSADPAPDSVRTTATVLFSDIKGSTTYFEKWGDARGVAMVQRHNDLLFPIIEGASGHVVKTIGDAIMAVFHDPKDAIRGAIGMQQALDADRNAQPAPEHIHIRVGLHTGLCLVKDQDVYGDVVNVASRVQHQAEPNQILITEDLLEAAKTMGVQCAQMGHEGMRGRVEPIEVYAVAWSSTSNNQLIEEVQTQFERKLADSKRQLDVVEQEFETAREQWRGERRRFTAEIERLGEALDRAKVVARGEVSNDLQSEVRFHLEEAVKGRQQAEQDLINWQAKWETERNQMNAQIEKMQRASIDAMEQANNPTRIALAVNEKIELRLKGARQDWEIQWEGERRRLLEEVERLKKLSASVDPSKKDAARRALLERLGKLPPGTTTEVVGKTAVEWEREFHTEKTNWDIERDQLMVRVHKAERELQNSREDIRTEILQEMRTQYEPQLLVASRELQRMNQEVEKLTAQLTDERQRNATRIELLEQAIPSAKDAAKKQVIAELQAEYESQIEELKRLKTRADRRYQDDSEEWEAERRRLRKQTAKLEEDLKEIRESSYRSGRTKTTEVQE
ncbi:MAG TPA: adenylate/guanylate cyclase domain-containing protein [Terriglobia bacterium]|nr:adenylate/guanylate cyclase domain-containing protein [Terriglobia bacterium]